MNRLMIFIILSLISFLYPQEEQIIKNIRTVYYKIKENKNSLKTDTLSIFGLSSEGIEVIRYRDNNNKMRLMTLWIYGELGKNYEEYYFKNDSLIFSFMQFHEYNAPFYMTNDKANEFGSEPYDPNKTIINEDMYYFQNNKLIRWLNKDKHLVDTKSRESFSLEKNLLLNLQKILDKINDK
jgi:hypothetical protein